MSSVSAVGYVDSNFGNNKSRNVIVRGQAHVSAESLTSHSPFVYNIVYVYIMLAVNFVLTRDTAVPYTSIAVH